MRDSGGRARSGRSSPASYHTAAGARHRHQPAQPPRSCFDFRGTLGGHTLQSGNTAAQRSHAAVSGSLYAAPPSSVVPSSRRRPFAVRQRRHQRRTERIVEHRRQQAALYHPGGVQEPLARRERHVDRACLRVPRSRARSPAASLLAGEGHDLPSRPRKDRCGQSCQRAVREPRLSAGLGRCGGEVQRAASRCLCVSCPGVSV
jgi:hypothetical protein